MAVGTKHTDRYFICITAVHVEIPILSESNRACYTEYHPGNAISAENCGIPLPLDISNEEKNQRRTRNSPCVIFSRFAVMQWLD